MHFRLKILIICGFFSCQAYNVKGQMPIIAYYGPVIEKMTLNEYSDLKVCGFTHSLNIYNTVEQALSDMTIANKVGIKVYVHTAALLKNTATTVIRLKNSMALAGYFLADEPTMADINKYMDMAAIIKRIDQRHECYINLHPYYSNDQMKSIGATSYSAYLHTASHIGLPQISFDFYPITKDGLCSETWFYTLNEIRRESLRTNVPFWGYVLSVPHNDYPQPTLSMLRLQVYVNLAYGAQAIQYFTYKLPQDKTYSFHNAPIDGNGKKTATYALVKKMNEELKKVAPLFYGARIEAIGHLIKIPSGCTKASTPVHIKSLKVEGRSGAVVSVFNKNSHKYMAIVNKDYEHTMTLTLNAKSKVVKYINKELVESVPNASYIIQAGDMALFKLQ